MSHVNKDSRLEARQPQWRPESCAATLDSPATTIVNDEDMVEQSHAVQVDGGRHIEVRSGQTNVIYDFDLPSRPCALGLSLSQQVRFYEEPDHDVLIVEAKNSINDYENSHGQFYLKKLTTIYKDDQPCCICLEEEPNVVMYQCGHQCCCAGCLKEDVNKCPLCRTTISAQIRVA